MIRSHAEITKRLEQIGKIESGAQAERQKLVLFLRSPIESIFDGVERSASNEVIDILKGADIISVGALLLCTRRALLELFSGNERVRAKQVLMSAIDRNSLVIPSGVTE